MAIGKFSNTKVKVHLGFLSIEGNWDIDETQWSAAWEMYVELVTRITTMELKKGEGLLRESLTSIYSFFDTTRQILKKYGPSVAMVANKSDTTFGHIAVAILNRVLRPLLSKWHPLLQAWESVRPDAKSPLKHELDWDNYTSLRSEINLVRSQLVEYANVLAEVAQVAKLHSK